MIQMASRPRNQVNAHYCVLRAHNQESICHRTGRWRQRIRGNSIYKQIFIANDTLRYLYALFIGIDANFRLKRKITSSEDRDPSLGGGWAFFVEEKAYKAHLTENWSQKQPVCSKFLRSVDY